MEIFIKYARAVRSEHSLCTVNLDGNAARPSTVAALRLSMALPLPSPAFFLGVASLSLILLLLLLSLPW